MVRECRPPAREPARSWLARRSTMATSTRANASSPASISPVGPPPAITTACPVIATLRPDTSTTTDAFRSSHFRRRGLAADDYAAPPGACGKPPCAVYIGGGEERITSRRPTRETLTEDVRSLAS